MLKGIAIILAVVVVGILIFAATKPDVFQVRRSAVIQAPPDKIFAYLNDFQRWGEWSPYEKLDPAMKRTYSGPASGPGAVYAWEGNSNAGIGGLSVRADKANIKRNFVITNNWTVDNHSRSSSRSVINLANVHNLTITGNRQPVQAGSFLDDENTTGRRVVRNNRLQP